MGWKNKARIFSILLVILVAGLISGCSSLAQDKLWVKSEGWSRAIKLGETYLVSPVPNAVTAEGDVVSVIFPKVEGQEEQFQPEIVLLSNSGELKQRSLVDLQIAKPGDAKILLSDDQLSLFWLEDYQLHAAELSLDGKLISEILDLTGDDRVREFTVDSYQDGYLISCSGNRDYPGAFLLLGDLDHLERVDLDPEGIRLRQYIDEDGQLQLGWVRYPFNYGVFEIYYLETQLPDINPDDKVLIHTLNITPAIKITGPALGFDQELTYFFWSQSIVSGLDVGVQTTYLQYFPSGEPEKVRPPMRISIPATQVLDEEPVFAGYFQVGNRVSMSGNFPRSSYFDNVSVIPGRYPELAFAFRSDSEFKWRDIRSQVNVGFITDGIMTSYQAISYTSTESNFPHLFQDQDQNLYLSWLEKDGANFYAYLATTDPAKRAVLDEVSGEDVFYLVAEGLFGILAGVVLSPFAAAVWGGAGLLAFVFNLVLSQFNKPIFRKIGEFLSVIGGVYIFWWLKMATLPGLFGDYVPFSAWIPRIPKYLDQPLIYGVPILIGLIALAVAWSKTYGKDSGSAINFHLLYAATDALLSCAIYGILIYGSF
ncbi:MAG: hypothetical protein AB8I40_05410 [Anaerolineales bacterium]